MAPRVGHYLTSFHTVEATYNTKAAGPSHVLLNIWGFLVKICISRNPDASSKNHVWTRFIRSLTVIPHHGLQDVILV